jgi:hypothetical protein
MEKRMVLTGRCKKSSIKFPLIPRTNIGTRKDVKIKNSRLLISLNLIMYVVFNVPNATLLYNHTEYTAERTIPAVENNKVVLLFVKIPIKSSSSPKKFDVPGKLIFASVNANKKNEKSGMTATSPP